jgi:hypothetical protein
MERHVNRRDLASAGIGATVMGAALVLAYALAQGSARPATVAAGDRAGDRTLMPSAGSAPGTTGVGSCELEMGANRNLVTSVHEYKGRFERVEEQREELARRLAETETETNAAAPPEPEKSEWDLSPDEAKELAKMGTLKLRYPCADRTGWKPPPDALQKLGLAPQDAHTLEQAGVNAYRQSWKEVRAMCATIDNAQPDRLGRDQCIELIKGQWSNDDPAGTDAALHRAAEVRAGLRSAPSITNTRLHMVERLAQVLAESQQSYERELAQALGPAEAHRIAWSEDTCAGYTLWEGAGEAID